VADPCREARPPSDEYLLRKLLRCGARMHGTRGSKSAVRRYMCSTRRCGNPCGERIVKAEALEGQLIDWIAPSNYTTCSCKPSRPKPPSTLSSRPRGETNCSTSYSACKTSTSSVTSPRGNTSCAAKPWRKNPTPRPTRQTCH
jgi:Recombinase zinc beta ribbon domain